MDFNQTLDAIVCVILKSNSVSDIFIRGIMDHYDMPPKEINREYYDSLSESEMKLFAQMLNLELMSDYNHDVFFGFMLWVKHIHKYN